MSGEFDAWLGARDCLNPLESSASNARPNKRASPRSRASQARALQGALPAGYSRFFPPACCPAAGALCV